MTKLQYVYKISYPTGKFPTGKGMVDTSIDFCHITAQSDYLECSTYTLGAEAPKDGIINMFSYNMVGREKILRKKTKDARSSS